MVGGTMCWTAAITGPSQARASIWPKVKSSQATPEIRREQAEREDRRGGDQEADCRDQRIGAGIGRAGAVADPAAEPGAGDAADQHDRAVEPGRRPTSAQAEAAVEEARQPEDQAVAEDRAGGGAEGEQPEARLAGERPRRLREGRRRLAGLPSPLSKPPRTGSRISSLTSERGGQAGEADDQEGRAPVEMGGDPAAEEDAERRADRDAEREEGERPRPPAPAGRNRRSARRRARRRRPRRTPTPIRARNSCQKFWARPQAAVNRLHKATEAAMIVDPVPRSASQAIGNGDGRIEEARRRSRPSRSAAVSLSPNSALIGTARMPMICRSTKLKM